MGKTFKLARKRSENLLKEIHANNLPIWVRAPTRGHEHYSGMSRAKLYDLNKRGLIKSKSLHDPGKERGCRLFLLSSILEYIGAPDEAAAA